MTRAGEAYASGQKLSWPPLSSASLIATYVSRSGAARHGGPITSMELAAWANGTRAVLGPIDFQDILDASRTYAAAASEYDGIMCPPPWSDLDDASSAEAEERFFDKIMGVTSDDG